MRNYATDQWMIRAYDLPSDLHPKGGWRKSNEEQLKQLVPIAKLLVARSGITNYRLGVAASTVSGFQSASIITDGNGALALLTTCNLLLKRRTGWNGGMKYRYPPKAVKPEKPSPRTVKIPTRKLNTMEIINTNKD